MSTAPRMEHRRLPGGYPRMIDAHTSDQDAGQEASLLHLGDGGWCRLIAWRRTARCPSHGPEAYLADDLGRHA